MLQVFYIGITKVDHNVAHVAMAIHVYCKYLFNMFYLFQMPVASVSSECCKCFIRILKVFILDVEYVLQWLRMCFSGVSDVCCKCFNCYRMYIGSVSSGCYKKRYSVAHVAIGSTCRNRML
jgi:hypothetical protein